MATITGSTHSSHRINVSWSPGPSDPSPVVVTAWLGGFEWLSTRCPGSSYALSAGSGSVCVPQNTPSFNVFLTDLAGHDISGGAFPASTLANSRTTIFAQRFPAGQGNTGQGGLHLTAATASPSLVNLSFFDLLVPKGNFIGHYERLGTSGDWALVDTLVLPDGQQAPDTAVSDIQSFNAPEHLNALAWLQPEGALVAFEYTPETGEHQAIPIIVDNEPVTQVNGKPAIAQVDQGIFNLFVPRLSDGRQQIVHLVHSNETIQADPWEQVAILPVPEGSSVVSIALVQADGQGSLKAVVRVRPSDGPDFLVSYQSDPNLQWQGPFPLLSQQGDIIRNVVGSPGLVQSIFGDQEELDLLVPIMNIDTGSITLTQFTQLAGIGTYIGQLPWTLTATLEPLNGDPNTQVVSASIIQASNRDLQAIAHVTTPDGQNLLVFYIFNQQTGWSAPSIVTSGGQPIIVGDFVTPPPSLISLTLNPASVLARSTSLGTVTLSSPAPGGGELINLVSANPQLAIVPASVTVVEGQTTATFNVSTVYTGVDSLIDISASLAGVTQAATLTVVGWVP